MADFVLKYADGRGQIHQQVASAASEKELLILERSHHIITRDVERGILHTRLRAFMERLAVRAERGSASDAGGPVSTRRAIAVR